MNWYQTLSANIAIIIIELIECNSLYTRFALENTSAKNRSCFLVSL